MTDEIMTMPQHGNAAPAEAGEDERFYGACARLLGADHVWREARPHLKVDRVTGTIWRPLTRAGRWSGREPGNGRFEGYGLIRLFGPERVHMLLRRPLAVNRFFESRDEALDFLARICAGA
jgi:hypothetical protein